MKKIICLILTVLALNLSLAADDTKSDADWKESGREALDATGQMFKQLGEALEKTVKEYGEPDFYGTWIYKSKNVTTTIICNEDGTMEINKRANLETDYWKGTFSSGWGVIKFDITESGKKTLILKTQKSDTQKSWLIKYSLDDEKDTLKVYSLQIPTDIDLTDFSKGVSFTKAK